MTFVVSANAISKAISPVPILGHTEMSGQRSGPEDHKASPCAYQPSLTTAQNEQMEQRAAPVEAWYQTGPYRLLVTESAKTSTVDHMVSNRTPPRGDCGLRGVVGNYAAGFECHTVLAVAHVPWRGSVSAGE